ncbi:sulfite reductase flavoprotein subunit alpha [Delftia acidovorans]|uniref:PepSY domain-containing protein n=1 Tax=Delftia acidovorans TaxID=80866 RepID=UPI0018E869B3|nr:sulfite reductase flavoprotein subunit alpha [Delftia acidovorans]MBJ2142442.1 sulfite reductase flavoprotein subunit alpha [Delftia acidovorans]
MTFKKIWFQLHWFVGITAGTVLIVIGLSGAVFSFHEEILGWMNPGTASVPARDAAPLAPPQIAQALREAGEQRVVQRITVFAEPGRSAQVAFKPPAGQRRGQTVFVDPYTGAQLPEQHGTEFFEWVERLHRWLLLSRDDGKPITGTLAGLLLMLSLSGLYLRWPRRPLSWRTWLTFDPALKGRSFLWGLHSVAGTWALVAYVVFTCTGMYWAFGVVRSTVDGWAGVPPRVAAPAVPSPKPGGGRPEPAGAQQPIDIAPGWAAFERITHGWQFAQLRLPERAGQPLQISWLDADAAHERARNQMALLPDGAVQRDERYADLPTGRRAVGAIYPLHMGTYFGMPGRIFMTLASLIMPLFAITGWMLYLDRRRKARALAKERQALMKEQPPSTPAGQDTVLVAFASQAGRAERLAVATVAALRGAGMAASLQSVAALDAEQLRHHRRVLFVASTFGEGDPPDAARRFARLLGAASGSALPHLQYGLLALGDRQYAAFCGFGHALDHQLRRLGAQPVFPLIEMDGEQPQAWNAWQQALAGHFGALPPASDALPASAAGPLADATAFAAWPLQARSLCNAGSQGAGLYVLELSPPEGVAPLWRAGALAEVLPRHGAATVQAWLAAQECDGSAPVQWRQQTCTLGEALAASVLPAPGDIAPGTAPQAVADALRPLLPRSYSVASLPQDGHVRLLVRQARHDGGLGVASGWLTAHAAKGTSVAMRLVENRAFEPREEADAEPDAPAIFIGNGSGYAGLRGHLLARMHAGRHRNWLLFGERQQAHDGYCEAEVSGWLAAGKLQRADFIYSRDQARRRYVQDALREAADPLRDWIADGAVLYVCGSADGMAAGVDAALADILGATAVEDLIVEGRYRRDVY